MERAHPTQTKRQRQAAATKRKTYNAGVKAINEKGYDAVSVEDITTAAHVAKGSFYTHFKSKEDLVFSTLAYSDEIYQQAYDQVQELAFLPQVTQFVRLTYMEYEKRGKGIIRAMVSNYFSQSGWDFYGKDRILLQCLAHIIGKGKADGLLDPEIPTDAYVETLLSSMVGVEVLWCFDQQDQSLADMMERTVRTVARGMIR